LFLIITILLTDSADNTYMLVSLFYFLSICGAKVEPSPLLQQPLIGLLYQPWIIDGDGCGAINGMNEWQGKLKYSRVNLSQCCSVHYKSHMT
jgi:hypothetical protein